MATKRKSKNYIPVTVPFSAASHAGEPMKKSAREISTWANRNVWTERMLDALTVGVRGGKWHALNDKVCSELNLFASARKVIGKKGAAGVDRQSTAGFGKHTIAEIKKLREQLRSRTYRPQAVRRVQIPKPGSDQKRPLGIATVTGKSTPVQSAFGFR
jgi:RNA-directed DNA polymerase